MDNGTRSPRVLIDRRTGARGRRPFFLHPMLIFVSSWGCVLALYAMHVSGLLIYSTSDAESLVLPIIGFFVMASICAYFLPAISIRKIEHTPVGDATLRLRRRLDRALKIWIFVTLIEVISSGGLPIIWTLTGSGKNYAMFGIPTIHGLMNAILLSITAVRFALGLQYRKRRDLFLPLFTVGWSFVVEARQLTIVVGIELIVLYLMYRKLSKRRIISIAAVGTILILLFGFAGNLRSGAAEFMALAQVTDYPRYLPSGFLWVYMYATTPLNNLINTLVSSTPSFDIMLPNTLAQLVPSAIWSAIGASRGDTFWQGVLVTQAFNVSTAFVGPVQDFGKIGVVVFAGVLGFLTEAAWKKRGLRNDVVYAVLAQCLVLSTFFDHFLYLPIIAQIPCTYAYFSGIRADLKPRRVKEECL